MKATLYRAKGETRDIKKRFNWSRRIVDVASYKLDVVDEDIALSFYPETKAELYRYTSFFTKEEGTIKWLEDTIQNHDVFFDIGANLGLYSLYATKLANVTTYAFEPHKLNYARLVENIRNNGLLDKITPIAIPLDSMAGLTTLHCKSWGHGGSMNQLGNMVDADIEYDFKEITYGMPLDDLIGKVPMPSVVKIDVDGNEYRILQGMKNILLSLEKPRSIQIEINPGYNDMIVEFMKLYDYSLAYRHYTSSAEIWGGATEEIPHNAVFTAL